MTMNLTISNKEESSRPSSLTNHLFLELMSQEIRLVGICQILEYERKRDRVYSTRMSDGYFKVKVMVIGEAAEQIEKAVIKQMSIVRGYLRNYGKAAIVVKEKLEYWHYDHVIGCPMRWKMGKENYNAIGSSNIDWDITEETTVEAVRTISLESTISFQGSKGKSSNTVETDKQHDEGKKRRLKISSQLSQENTEQTSADGTQEMFMAKDELAGEEDKDEEVDSEDFVYIAELIERRKKILAEPIREATLESSCEEFETVTRVEDGDERDKRLKWMRDLFDDADSADEVSIKRKSTWKNTQNNGKVESSKKISPYKRKLDIKQILDDIDISPTEDNHVNIINNNDESNKSNKESHEKETASQDDDYIARYLKNQPKKVSEEESSYNPFAGSFRVSFQEIYNGLIPKHRWWGKYLIKAVSEYPINNTIRCMVCDEESQLLLPGCFVNLQDMTHVIEEGKVYSISNVEVKELYNCAGGRGCQSELEFNCRKIVVKEDPGHQPEDNSLNAHSYSPSDSPEQSFDLVDNYCPIKTIYTLPPNTLINIIAIIKSKTTLRGKHDKCITNYELVDIIDNYTIIFTVFSSNELIANKYGEKYVEENWCNKVITVYCVKTVVYQNNVRVNSTVNSVIKIDWIPHVWYRQNIIDWLGRGNSVMMMKVNMVGFKPMECLQRVYEDSSIEVYINNVELLTIKCMKYPACRNCYKRMDQNSCGYCGYRGMATERMFLRTIVGDYSRCLNAGWGEQESEEIIRRGIKEFEKEWMLVNLSCWLRKTNEDMYIICQMEKQSIRERNCYLLEYIKKRLI